MFGLDIQSGSARLLSYQSLLHIGYREVEDKEKLVTERHRYNLETVDGRIMQKEFMIASPRQQQVIKSFTTSSTKRHLVLEGPAGTDKTLVALQVANNLMESIRTTTAEGGNEPLLIVTAPFQHKNYPIMKYLDASTGGGANKILKRWGYFKKEFRVSGSKQDTELPQLCEAVTNRADGRQIVLVVDEIYGKDYLSKSEEQCFPETVRMILIQNPKGSSTRISPLNLPPTFLQVTLTTPYRSTMAITRLGHFIAKFEGSGVPEGEFGSDVEGTKPILFNIDEDKRKMKEALKHCRKHLGDNVTILSDYGLPESIKDMVKEQGKHAGGPWDHHKCSWYSNSGEGGCQEYVPRGTRVAPSCPPVDQGMISNNLV